MGIAGTLLFAACMAVSYAIINGVEKIIKKIRNV